LFPEYNTNSNSDMFPDTNNNYTGWYIWKLTNQKK
jgi:hypothetical protein